MALERARALAAAHPDVVQAIPKEPEKGFHALPKGVNIKWADAGIFEKLGRCDGEHPNCENNQHPCRARVWTLTPEGEEIIKSTDEPSGFPCGHRGLRTITPGKKYTCVNDDCDEVYSKEMAQELDL